jgi:hypothetical protein
VLSHLKFRLVIDDPTPRSVTTPKMIRGHYFSAQI